MNKEEILLTQLNKGSESAFEAFFNIYSTKILQFSRRYLKNEAEAENATQEVFIRIWELRATLDPQKPFSAFVFSIAKNILLNRLKRIALEARLAERIKVSPPSKDTDENILYNELEQTINNAIAGLPEERQKIFRLSRFEGLTNREIAEKMNLSVKTVENQMGYALKSLKEKILYWQ